MAREDVCVIIPAYNEGGVIKEVIAKARSVYGRVVCIDDGSVDDTAKQILETKAVLVQHPFNMGQGAALQTGIEYALQSPEVQYFITFDSDGQHDIQDARRMLAVLQKEELDIVLGSRFLGEAVNITGTKRLVLKLATWFTNVVSRVNLTDTHNGLRVFNRRFAESVNITMPGMAHASEIIDKMGRGNWQYKEVPVTIHYNDYTRNKGQSILNSVNISIDILLHKVRR